MITRFDRSIIMSALRASHVMLCVASLDTEPIPTETCMNSALIPDDNAEGVA